MPVALVDLLAAHQLKEVILAGHQIAMGIARPLLGLYVGNLQV